jgi:hypothetical protein
MERKVLEFDTELLAGNIKIENVSCEIILPELQNEDILLEISLEASKENYQLAVEISGGFSLRSLVCNPYWKKEISVSSVREITSTITGYYEIETTMASKQQYIIVKAIANDVKIRVVYNENHKVDQNINTFQFWLTQSTLLPKPQHIEQSIANDSGEDLDIYNPRNQSFEIREGLEIKFISYCFCYFDAYRSNVKISEQVLAAELSNFTEKKSEKELLAEIEFFLMIASFSERRRIACYGYRAENIGSDTNDIQEVVDYYRPSSHIPAEDFNYTYNNILIDGEYFREFIIQALSNSIKCEFKEYLLEAIEKIVYRKNISPTGTYLFSTDDYLSCYSALENLVNGFRDIKNLHFILEEKSESCNKFSNDIQNFIRKHSLFAKTEGDSSENERRKNKRKLMHEKISELNRISFGTAFRLFCEFYQVDITDLWPLTGKSKEVPVSLSMIRDRIIHGERFEHKEYESLVFANINLRWILERCILRILGWDIKKSRVHPLWLKSEFAHSRWQEFSTYLSKEQREL